MSGFGLGPTGGVTVDGWPCPSCLHEEAEALHLEPPYGALVACLACDFQFPVAF